MSVRNKFRVVAGALMACWVLSITAIHANAVDFVSESLEIHRQDGKVLRFTVELASSDAQRQQGLMNRETMKSDHGMLFDFGMSRPVFMWMKNTYLPLDMLFISERGEITHISENALPLSEAIIDSHGLVRYVLEINGGLGTKLGIKVGDTVRSKQVDRSSRAK